MKLKFNKKKWIIIGIVILSPVIIFALSFILGKILLAIKRTELRKAGIPTTYVEYKAKYYHSTYPKEDASKLIHNAFQLYRKYSGGKTDIYRDPILDQKIQAKLLDDYRSRISNNKLFLMKLKN